MGDSDFLDALMTGRAALETRAERVLRAEVGRLKAQLENLYSEDPCPHCGRGVSAQCYGCLWKKAEAEVERLRAENVEWQDRALADQTARGEAEAKLAKVVEALYRAAWALDTTDRVARACMEPTGTNLDGESKMRWAQAKREQEKAHELMDPIFAALAAAKEKP